MAVYKREGHWHFRKTINGKRYRGALKTARNKMQAQQAEAALILEIHNGTYGARKDSAPRLAKFVEEVFKPWGEANRRAWRKDKWALEPILAFFGKKRLDEIHAFDIESYKLKRKATPTRRGSRSVASVNRELAMLHRIFSMAIRNKKFNENPCSNVKKLVGEQPRTRYLRPDEEARLLGACNELLRGLVVLALGTGMRRGELLRLRWANVDFLAGEIKVVQTKTSRDRFVPMSKTVRDALFELRAANEGEFVFPSRARAGGSQVDCKTAFRAACRRAGIVGFRFHDLRHTFATRASDAGCSISAIAEVMGHSSILTTKRYSHATDPGRRRVVESVDKLDTKKTQSLMVVGE